MRKLAILVLSLIIAFSLMALGCQKKEEAPKPAETTTAPEKKEMAPAQEAMPEQKAPEKKEAGGY